MYTTTGQLKAALCEGALDLRAVLDALTDRHFGKAPEPGVLRSELVEYCRKALRTERIFRALQLIPLLWTLTLLAGLPEGAEPGIAFLPPLLVAVGIALTERIMRHRELMRLRDLHRDDGSNEELKHSATQSLVVYSGFDAFGAFGVRLDAWSLSIDVTKGGVPDSAPEEFTSTQLVDHLSNALKAGIPGAVVYDCLFARGTMIQGDVRLLGSKTASPNVSVDRSHLERMVGNVDPNVRHYRVASFRIPGSQAIFTTLFRSAALGGHQFVECHQYLLASLRRDVCVLDNLKTFRPLHFYLGAVAQSIPSGIWGALTSGPWVAGFVVGKLLKLLPGDSKDKAKRFDPHFDYGHKRSIRTKHSADEYDSFFQSQDKEMLRKSMDARMLNSLVAFLKAHKIDVGDLESSKQQIFNSGVIVSGGTFKAGTIAVGDGANARGAAVATPQAA